MDPINIKLLAFSLVFTRVSAFIAVSPIFSWPGLPVRIKIGLSLFISSFIAMQQPAITSEYKFSVVLLFLLISRELLYGILLGMICMLIFSTIRIFGRIAETQMGLNMSQILDPFTGEQGQPLSMIVELCFIMVFLSAEGHHFLLLALTKSYENYPVNSIPEIPLMLEGIVAAGSIMLIGALKMAGPILAAFIFMLVVLAVFARIAPEMNILFISMPIRVAIGLVMAAIFVPFTNSFITRFSQIVDHLLPI